jgi:hypothetical protein
LNTGALKFIFNLLSLGAALVLGFSLALRPLPPGTLDEALRLSAEGRQIASQGALAPQDKFSYSQGLELPSSHASWGSSLLFFGLSQTLGLKAFLLLRALSLLSCLALLLATGFRRGARPFSTACFSLWALACVAACPDAAAMLGLALFSACLFLMEGPFWEAFFGRWVFLPLLAVAWVNLHSAALLLIPLAWVWAFAEGGPGSGAAPGLPLMSRLSVLALISACLFLHPAFLRLPWEGVDFVLAPAFDPAYFPQAQKALAGLALGLVLLVSSSWLPSGRQHLGRDAWIFVGFFAASLGWSQILPYAALWAAPMLAARADILIDVLPEPLRRARWLAKAALLAWGLSLMPRMLAGGAGGASRAAAAEEVSPKGTLAFMREQLLQGNVLVEPAWSGRTLEALSPGVRVFVHEGMPFAAKQRGMDAWHSMAALDEGWEKRLEESGSDFALLKIDSPLAKALARSGPWQPVDFDDASVLYAHAGQGNAALIKTFAPRGLRPGDLAEPFDQSRLPQAGADLEERLLRSPKLGLLYYFEARLWRLKGKPALARQWAEKGLRMDPGFAGNAEFLRQIGQGEGRP